MKALVTGGAGFIGRWLVKKLLEENHEVWVLDNLENGQESNLEEFSRHPLLKNVFYADILNRTALHTVFQEKPDIVYHLAAQINVQESLNDPQKAHRVNVEGTYNVLEECKTLGTKLTLMGTCHVYGQTPGFAPVNESFPLNPVSPYAASKAAAEIFAHSYYKSYGLPIVICRPFNTYGPFQKSNMEGGVVSIFVKRFLDGKTLDVFGDGLQTRDLLYVEDCVDFVYRASRCKQAEGEILNAGLGKDISILDLAHKVCQDKTRIRLVEHHHPQAEIGRMICDYSKARAMLNWEPKTDLDSGIKKIQQHIGISCVSA